MTDRRENPRNGTRERPAVEIGKLLPSDRPTWEVLWRGYNDFYRRTLVPEYYERAWSAFQEDSVMHAFGARIDGELVAITHFFIHPSTWGGDVCYLQDLFTRAEARGRGAGRALIAAVVDWARERGCSRVYWMTEASNSTARRLYDQVGVNRGFIRYDIEL